MITMHSWMAALGLASFIFAATVIMRKGLPLLAPVASYLFTEKYHRSYSAHRKTRRSYKTAEIRDLKQSNFSVPENWVDEVADPDGWSDHHTLSEITAQYDREILATYERTDSGQLRELPFNTSEIQAITDDVPPSSVRVYWGSQETVPDVYSELPPYPTDLEVDPFAYDGSRWAPTQILEPVG